VRYFKDQYKNDIHYLVNDSIPYAENETAINRINKIYSTARKGRLGYNLSNQIWGLLSNIYNGTDLIPNTLDQYNEFAKRKIKCLSTIISVNHQLKIGIAQKVFNLFMKDLWAWDRLNKRQEKVLHFPLDRQILNLLKDNPWPAWTKIVVEENNFVAGYGIYLDMQRILRSQLRYSSFHTPLELEQFLWHGFF
jgi:hypothetical protein